MAIPTERLVQAIDANDTLTGRTAMTPYLTPRERAVLALLTSGKTTREISTELQLSEGTVKAHLNSIYRKLGVSNRTEAAVVGLRVLSLLPSS